MINLFSILLIAAFLVFVVPLRWKGILTALLVTAGVAITSGWGVEGLRSEESLRLAFSLTGLPGMPELVIDRLSGFFILVINITSLVGIFYALGYLKPYQDKKTPLRFSIHYFSYFWLWVSMILLTGIREGFPFLVVWEFMTVSSFLLVIFDAEDRKTLKTGINYLIQMHIGLLFIMVAFLIVGEATGQTGFAGLREYFATHSNLLVFALFFIGFGIKAGFIPLHTWLPQAHPAAPSHVSGLMSGVMIKMGIFGILRVVSELQSDMLAIGLIILGISLLSGIIGVMMAIVQHDLKKLLAYHSIENIGIIGIGMGLGVVGLAVDNPGLATLGFAGGILHILNHSLFKSLLFFNAGSVYTATHTRNIEGLGGLIKKMPVTALFFLIGSLAICGLPPFNGFISEYLIFSGMFKSVAGADLYLAITLLFSISGLALIGGLAIFCFTKAFGMVFLGTSRRNGVEKVEKVEKVEEVGWGMLGPQVLIVILILAVGLGSAVFVKPVVGIVGSLFELNSNPDFSGAITLNLGRISLIGGIFILLIAGLWLVRKISLRNKTIAYGPTWGCGFTEGDVRQQYTATSYSDNYATLANPLLRIQKEMEPIRETEIFPGSRSFKTKGGDVFKRFMVDAPVGWILSVFKKIAIMQTGQIQHYILYAFVFMIVIFILTFFNLI